MSAPTHLFFTATPDEKGRLNPDDATIVRARLAKWAGKHCNVTIERYVKRKTQNQLGYFFTAIITAWMEHSGYNKKEMEHELWLAFMPTKEETSRITGEITITKPRISEASSEVMAEFITACLGEAAKQGMYIPTPEEHFMGPQSL